MIYLCILFSLMILTGCEQKSQVRHYTEVVVEAPKAQMPPMMAAAETQDPHAGLDMSAAPMMPTVNNELKDKLSWSLPKGWMEEPGNGMRLVSFHLKDDPKAIDVSVVSLGGMAGGLPANLKRWLGQISVDVSDEQLQSFIQDSPDNIFDFTKMQQGADPSSKSMIAAMLTIGDATVFVKMSGTIESVNQHKRSFLALVKSVHTK